MKLFKFVFIVSINILVSQGLKITHMEGTYDLDEDGFQEFASVEEGLLGNKKSSVVRYYELDGDGYQKMGWELDAPDGLLGNFVNVKLGDLDGDGVPELVTVSNLAELDRDELLQPIAFYYYWDGERFSEDAGSVLNLSGGRNFVRAHNFVLMDYDGDLDQELAISLGSPLREIVVLDLNDAGEWYVLQSVKPSGMSSGVGAIFVAAVDWNHDGYDEIITFSPEGNILRAQPFYNLGAELLMGENQDTPIPGLDGLIPNAISTTDWDKDGLVDVLLPFYNGDVFALALTDDFLSVEKLTIEGGPLSSMRVADFNQDAYDDLLFVSGDLNLLTLVHGSVDGLIESEEYFALEEKGVGGTQVFSALPIVVRGIYAGSVIAAGWDGNETAIFITELGHGPEPKRPEVSQIDPQEEDVLDVFPHIPKEEMSLPKVPRPLATMGQPLPCLLYTSPSPRD